MPKALKPLCHLLRAHPYVSVFFSVFGHFRAVCRPPIRRRRALARGGGVLLSTLLVVAVAVAVDVIVEMEKPHENGIGDRETTANERCMNANARLA